MYSSLLKTKLTTNVLSTSKTLWKTLIMSRFVINWIFFAILTSLCFLTEVQNWYFLSFFFYFFKKPFCRQKWLDTHLSERWERNPTKVATFYGVWYYTKNSVYIIFSDPHQPIGHYYYLHWTDEKSKAQRDYRTGPGSFQDYRRQGRARARSLSS